MSEQQQSNSQGSQTTKPTTSKEQLKLIEAKTAVILLKTSKLCTKNEYTQWLLKMLYQPYSRQDTEQMNIIYLSRSRRRIWNPDFSINQEQSKGQTVNKNRDQLYVITPQTTLMTISQHNRIVYIVDLSSSLATIGDRQCNILLSEVYQTLHNSLEGLVQAFSMQISPTEKAVFRPSIRTTIIADYSQFASNINLIPILTKHPTMRVFLQNVIITATNISTILRRLRAEFISFQEDIAAFRRFIREHRINMDYDLDVGSKADPTVPDVLDATSFHPKEDINKDKPNGQSESHVDMAIEKDKDTGYHSSKKEVWGVGKSGASLSRILHAGHFALKLLPREGSSHLVLITDGAMKSNILDNTFVRQFAEEDINCHVIQVGSKSGFIPGKNFGFVPDTEVLKFLARATSGTFLYSEKCVPIASTSHEKEITEPSQESDQAVVQIVGINQAKQIANPNIYHYHFLFREATFSRIGNEVRLAESDSRRYLSRRNLDGEHIEWPLNFPWDPNAQPPEEECRLLKYKEYSLPSEFSHIVAARAREGFSIQSVTFDEGSSTRTVDPGIQDLEAKDLSSIRKERIQILMAMHWQPNVVIEYRIRATWLPVTIGNAKSYNKETLLMSSGLFYRAKAPRAEILVRTDASFAHMLQNWDVFKRRAQMMGVVTGYIYFGETYAAPVYSKIEKLKNYLVDIYEGDETLKSIIGFPNKFWTNLTTAESIVSASRIDSQPSGARYVYMHHQEMFIDSFKAVWNRMNAAETRARTRCWYDPECIDLLIGDVSPFMDPKLLSPYNQEFISNAQENITAMLDNVRTVLKEWADFEGDDGTLVKMLHRNLPTIVTGHDDGIKESFAPSPFKLSPSFCELRIRHEYGRLITLRLLFFNTEVTARRKVREHLLHLLKTSQLTGLPYNIICQRPFSSLLMRDSKHFSDGYSNSQNGKALGDLTKHQNRSRAWYLPFATWLTSEYIVRDYLHHITWTWQTDSHDDTYHRNNKMMPIHDLAFQFLCQARLDQGYQLVSPRPDSTQFYQEITLPAATGNRTCRCAIQYFIWKDSVTGKITTELWMEPAGEFDASQYDRIKSWAFEPDRRTISELVTFDQIHAVGRSRGIGELREKRKNSQTVDVQEEKNNVMLLPQLFDVALVLRSNRFAIASFKSPVFEKSAHLQQIRLQLMLPQSSDTNKVADGSSVTTANSPIVKNKSLIKTHRYFRRAASSSATDLVAHSSVPLEDQNPFILKPDSLLLKSSKTIVKLSTVLQNYSILHYFVERSLEYISNGEINMANHDLGISFWNELKAALKKVCDYQKVSSTSLVSDLRKTRCFVKVFDPRSFVIILFPSLECASSSLLKLQKDDPSNELVSGPPISYHMDVFMFECTRQKPMKPAKETSTHGAPYLFSEEDLVDASDSVTIQPIEYLIHKFDGVGRTLRPSLYRGYFSSCQSNAQLTERVLRVAQDIARGYSKSFFNSLYSCLLKGFLVDDNDLGKVLEVCNESSMEIDITEYVSIMALQDKNSAGLDVQMSEAQGKFNAIFNQYFQPVYTKNKSANLFYFKPSTNKYNSAFFFEDTSEDSKVSSLLSLAAHSRSPLLVKLFCVSRIIEADPIDGRPRKVERSVPVNTLPTLGMDILEKNVSFDSSFLDGFPTSKSEVLLQLVFLSMPKTELEKSDSKENDMLPEGIEKMLSSMKSQPECFSALSIEQQISLVETESRVRWLLIEEVLHGLLKVPNITPSVLTYVEQNLHKLNPYLGYESSITMPLHFVKNCIKSRLIFMDELEKDSYNSKRRYKLKRLGDHFYVSEDTMFNMDDESSYSNSGSPVTGNNRATSDPGVQCDNFCEGLGITLFEATKLTKDKKIIEEEETNTLLAKRPLYWLILIPYERYVQIYYYSKMQILAANSDVLNAVKEKVKYTEERTNRIILLNHLQETRACSKYLEVPSVSNESDTSSEESNEELTSDDLSDIQTYDGKRTSWSQEPHFAVGQFACPLLLAKRIPLHWRLQPNITLKVLASDVLRLFTVTNRPNMFVVERDGSIVYCKIFEEVVDGSSHISPSTICSSPGYTEKIKFMDDDARTVASLCGEQGMKRDLSMLADTGTKKKVSTNPRPAGAETRELVIQIFGVDLPNWVEAEFVNMIENRVLTQITLTEVQQFFARNTTSKPTLADVEFILPVRKAPTIRDVLRVPSIVTNPSLLLYCFSHITAADNIKPLHSPDVTEAIKLYHENVFYNENHNATRVATLAQSNSRDFQLNKDGLANTLCFYYNCTKRVPGSSTSLELLVGQGMAGICVTLLDKAGEPVVNGHTQASSDDKFDPSSIPCCFEHSFREITSEDTEYYLWIDIWSIGAIDSSALIQHLYTCYQQSLCDYFIEKTVTMNIGSILTDKSGHSQISATNPKGRLRAALRSKFIDSVLYILNKAPQKNNPTVLCMNKKIQASPWYISDLLRFLDAKLRKLGISFRPVIACTFLDKEPWNNTDSQPKPSNEWLLYKEHEYLSQSFRDNIRLVAISGLQEFVEKFENNPMQSRRLSVASTVDSQASKSRRDSEDSVMTDNSSKHRNTKSIKQERSRASSTISSSTNAHKNGPQLDGRKHCFLMLNLDANNLSVYTYNWSQSFSADLFKSIDSIINRQEARNGVLTNILHQKMGLFHHTNSIKHTVEKYNAVTGNTSKTTNASSSLLHSASPVFKKSVQTDHLNPKGPNQRISENNGSPQANMLDLKDLITYASKAQLEAHSHIDPASSPIVARLKDQEAYVNMLLQRSMLKNFELDQALMDSITDSVADSLLGKDTDILRRHGQTFMETLMRRSKVQSAHRKALKVYIKWRNRYGNIKTEPEAAEKLTRQEVSTIIRSSRVLHFCRAPLIFCDPEKDWQNASQGQTTQAIVDWYVKMANSLITEYATYLEGADMQLLEFAKSEDDEAERVMKSSEFVVGKQLTATCSPVYLLSVFEGGSIICEVRLTGIFLSVTLYSLHRQYGRLDYRRFHPETRNKKRENFRKFEENCGRFKQLIHINSFVYDFHIRYFSRALEAPETLPSDFDIVFFMRRFSQPDHLPPPFCKDRLIHGMVHIKTFSVSLSTFFENLLKICTRSGWNSVLSRNSFLTASISSNDLSFNTLEEKNKGPKAQWKYTLAISPGSKSTHKKKSNSHSEHDAVIEYFILVSNQEKLTPDSMARTSWYIRNNSPDEFEDLAIMKVANGQCSLKSIISGVKAKIDGIAAEAITMSRQIQDWNKLYSANINKNTSSQKMEHPELIALLNQFERIDVTELDDDIASIFKLKLNWDNALNMITAMARNNAKDFYANGARYVLLYNARYMDFMIVLTLSPSKVIQGWLVTREKRPKQVDIKGPEQEQVVSLAKNLYYHLWRVVSNKDI